jgi:hypothetical protein
VFNCPHCGESIETSPGDPEHEKSFWQSQYARSVSIGGGSLFAIALIVALCSGAGTSGTSQLRSDIRELDSKIERVEELLGQLKKEGLTPAEIPADKGPS